MTSTPHGPPAAGPAAAPDEDDGATISVESPAGYTSTPDSLLLNTDVSDGAYRLYALLKHHARQESSAYPGRRRLARMLGVKSLRTVDKRLTELKVAGYLDVRPRWHASGGRSSNHYHLRFYPVLSSNGVPDEASDRAPGSGANKFASTRANKAVSTRGEDRAVLPEGVQPAARGPRNDLPPAQAAGRTGAAQQIAHQEANPLPSTPSPTTPARANGLGGSMPDLGQDGMGEVSTTHTSEDLPERDPHTLGAAGADQDVRGEDAADGAVRFAEQVIDLLPAQLLPLTRSMHAATVGVLTPLAGTWEPRQLVDAVLSGRPLPEHVTSPAGLLRSRVEDLLPPRSPKARTPLPPWCGGCDERTRTVEVDDATWRRCPACHPLTHRGGNEGGTS